MKKIIAAMVFLMMAVVFPLCVNAQVEAQNIANECEFENTGAFGEKAAISDGSIYTFSKLHEKYEYWGVAWGERSVQGIYITWRVVPGEWTLLLDGGTGFGEEKKCEGKYLQEYIELPEGTKAIRMVRPQSGDMVMCDIEVYTEGALPEEVHIWQPTPTTAELMVISAHQDDEVLYLGGTIPYYAGEKQLDTVVVYMANCEVYRHQEALNGLWECGLRQYPVFLGLRDELCYNIEDAKEYWDAESTQKKLAELFLTYRPQVIVTQDENGEYGHGAHKLMVHLIKQALVDAASAGYVAENFADKQPWNVRKCYFHLGSENQIIIPWDEMYLERLGGISAHEAARRAYGEHKSQHIYYYYSVDVSGAYDCRKFSLYHTTVGADIEKNDFFENITLRIENAVPPQTAIYAGMERMYENEYVYKITSGEVDTMWVRYGRVEGTEGWYFADSTGALCEPVREYRRIEDMQPPEIEQYSAITVCSDSDIPIYEYSLNGQSTKLRYGEMSGEQGWYRVDEKGCATAPFERVNVLKDEQYCENAYDSKALAATRVTAFVVLGVSLLVIIVLICSRRFKRREKQ